MTPHLQHLIGTYECKADIKGRIMLPIAIKKQLEMTKASDELIFEKLRLLKDNF